GEIFRAVVDRQSYGNPRSTHATFPFFASGLACLSKVGAAVGRAIGQIFFANPGVGLGHAVTQTDRRFPAQVFLDLGVVAVAAVHALGSAQVVGPLQLDAGDVLGDVDQLVDRHELTRAQIDRFQNVAVED